MNISISNVDNIIRLLFLSFKDKSKANEAKNNINQTVLLNFSCLSITFVLNLRTVVLC